MLDGMYDLPIALLETFTAIVFVGVYWIGCFVLRFGFKYTGGIMSFFLGALILLIAVLERPYQSIEYGVSPAPYEMVYQVMEADRAATK